MSLDIQNSEELRPKTVKIKGAAVLIGVSEKSVRRLIDRQQLHAIRVLRHLLIPLKEIDRFLAK